MKRYILALVLVALFTIFSIGTGVIAFAEDTETPVAQEENPPAEEPPVEEGNPTEQPPAAEEPPAEEPPAEEQPTELPTETQFGTDFFGRLAEFIYVNTAEVIAALGTILSAIVTAFLVFLRNKLIDGSRKANELTATTMAQVGNRISNLEQQSGDVISSVNTMIESYNKNSESNDKLTASYQTTEEKLAATLAENEKMKAGMDGLMDMLRELALHANLTPTVKDIIDKFYIRAKTAINPQDTKTENAEAKEDEKHN